MGDIKEGQQGCQATAPNTSQQRWSILRHAIVHKKAAAKKEGSIHQFPGFGLLRRQRLPRNRVMGLQKLLTTVRVEDDSHMHVVETLELSLLALTALRPAEWAWEFCLEFAAPEKLEKWQREVEISQLLGNLEERLMVTTSKDPKQRLRLGDGSGWVANETDNKNNNSVIYLKIVLRPFVPSQGIYQYILPTFNAEGELVEDNDMNPENEIAHGNILYTRERLSITTTSLHELTSHHRNKGVDNTGNICVWDSEQTMTFGLMKEISKHPWWPKDDNIASLDILELGAGMAGLAGFALAQELRKQGLSFRLFLTDGHPQAIQNNQINAHLMQLRSSVQCFVLPWFVDPISSPSNQQVPPQCNVAIVSDCTHFQEFHAHLFFTLAYSLKVDGYGYLCQPHRGKSLQRFLDLVNVKSTIEEDPIFSLQWLEIPELVQAAKKAEQQQQHYNPDIHYPHWILLRKLREVREQDHALVMEHMDARMFN